jgi:hypothetical protein
MRSVLGEIRTLAERRAALTWGRTAMAMGAAMMEFIMVEGNKKKWV